MPFLNKRSIALKVRAQAEKDYKDQLRSALQNPTLTPEQRHLLRTRLKQVGQPRVYDANSPPQPGAIQNTPPEPVVEVAPAMGTIAAADLNGMKKAQLQAAAKAAGLPISGTKAMLIARLLKAS